MGYDRERAEALNTDHHRRMSADAAKRASVGNVAVAMRDSESRVALVGAMKGCAERWKMDQPMDQLAYLLELGAGYGGDAAYLMRATGAEYLGVEVVGHVAEAARKDGHDILHMALEEALPEWDGKFHYIYSRHVMEHVTDLGTALKTLKRILAPNGVIGAVTPHYFPDPEPAHVTQLRIDQWMQEYKKAGLKAMYARVEHFACEEAHLVLVHEEWPTGS